MKQRFFSFLLAGFWVILIFGIFPVTLSKKAFAVPESEYKQNDFILKDTDDVPFQLSEYLGQVVILSFIPDTENREVGATWLNQSRIWMQKIKRRFGDRLKILGMKEVTDLPMFVPKAIVKMKLGREPFPYLIDWDGKVFDKFAVYNTYTLMVLDTSGVVAYRFSEPFTETGCQQVCSKIKQALQKSRVKEKLQ